MACCAFALFCLFWLTAPFRALARRLGRQPRVDAAVLWVPGAAPVRRRRARPALLGMALGTGMAGALAIAPVMAAPPGHPADRQSLADLVRASVCRGWLGEK